MAGFAHSSTTSPRVPGSGLGNGRTLTPCWRPRPARRQAGSAFLVRGHSSRAHARAAGGVRARAQRPLGVRALCAPRVLGMGLLVPALWLLSVPWLGLGGCCGAGMGGRDSLLHLPVGRLLRTRNLIPHARGPA